MKNGVKTTFARLVSKPPTAVQLCAKAQACKSCYNPLRDMDQLGTGVDWECRTGAPPPLVCHSPILLIHVSTRPQSGRIAVVWPPSAVASVVAARAAVGRAGGYVGYFREVRGAAGAGAVDPRAAPMAHSSLRRAWAREIAIRCDAMRVWGRTWSGVPFG